MKKKYLSILFLFLIFYSFSDNNYKKDARFFYEIFYPVDEGTKNQEKLINYIIDYFKKNNVNYSVYDIIEEGEFSTNSKSIEVFLKAKNDTKDTIVILTSLNTPIINNRYFDNSISIELILNLIEIYSKTELKKNLLFGFIGAIGKENWNKYGFIKFLDSFDKSSNSIITFIDILSINRPVYFTGSRNQKPLPAILVKSFDKANKEKNILFDSLEIKKAKLNLLPQREYLDLFSQNEIIAVEFSNREDSIYNLFYYDIKSFNNYLDFLKNWINELINLDFNFEKEYNYLYEDIFGYKIFIKERTLIIVFLFLIFIILLTRFFFPNFERLRISTMFKIFHYFLFLFLCYFLLSFIPVVLLTPVDYFYNIEKVYLNIPFLYFLMIFFLSFLIIIIVIDIFKKLPLPRHSYIYIIGAVLFSNINLILLSFFNISFAYIFIWAIIFITFSNFTGRNYVLKFIFYFLSSIPFIKFIFDITFMGNINIIKNLYENIFLYNFIFTLISFPFMFILIRAYLIIKGYFKFSFSKRKILFISILFLIFFTFIFSLVSINFSPQEQKIIAKLVTNYDNNRSYLEISSNNKLKEFLYEYNNEKRKMFCKDNSIRIPVIKPSYQYKVKYNIYKFYDYDRYEIIIESDKEIEYLNAYIYVPYLTYIFNSNYLFFSDNEKDFKQESMFQLRVPRNPGKNIKIIFETFKNISPRLSLLVKYIDSSSFKLDKPNSIIKYEKEFIETIILK